jgi:tRNA(Ile)-lysidine synthase TilS/MesJ
MELMRLSLELNCGKIALGHHLDDIVETYLMNICLKGEVSTMLPTFKYDRYPQTVIRPLALVKESMIIDFAKSMGLQQLVCQCPYGQNSKRKEIREAVRLLAKNNKGLRENIFKSMHQVKPRYLMEEDRE